MLMKHFSASRGCLIDGPVDNASRLGCRTAADVVVDGSALSRNVVVLVTLLVVMYPNLLGGCGLLMSLSMMDH